MSAFGFMRFDSEITEVQCVTDVKNLMLEKMRLRLGGKGENAPSLC